MDATGALERPQFFRIFKQSLSLSWLAYKGSPVIVLLSLAGGFAFAAVLPELHSANLDRLWHDSWDRYQLIQGLTLGVASAAPCMRLVRPGFRFTTRSLFGAIFYTIAEAFLTLLGVLALILPGIYIATRLSLTVYVYLLGYERPLNASWAFTRGYVLEVLSFSTALAALNFAISWLAGGLVFAASSPSGFATLILTPIGAACSLYGYYVTNAALTLLTLSLVDRDGS